VADYVECKASAILLQVYDSIKESGAASTSHFVSKFSDLGPDGIESVIADLQRLGLVRQSPFENKVVSVVPAEHGILSLIDASMREQETISELQKALLATLTERGGELEPANQLGEFEIIEGREACTARLHSLTAAAKLSVATYIPYTPSSSQLNDALLADKVLAERGLLLRVVYSPIAESDPNIINYISDFSEHYPGLNQVRVSSTINPKVRFTIVDKGWAYIRILDGSTNELALITSNPQVIGLANIFFEHLWSNAKPFELSGKEGLTARESLVIRLIAEGKTHSAIAKELGIAPRTVDRMLERLDMLVGAASRIDMALRIQKLGWLN